ncbi:PREDICTED: malectin [Haliaeetus leucocephalus]|uniref:malectin n=1 Tax=Haliaeetus leucocephalus TaxID=52644 RepID=UPI00053CE412|nr:PREDICTED: malectin [Haliaeetus leucocephalus]
MSALPQLYHEPESRCDSSKDAVWAHSDVGRAVAAHHPAVSLLTGRAGSCLFPPSTAGSNGETSVFCRGRQSVPGVAVQSAADTKLPGCNEESPPTAAELPLPQLRSQPLPQARRGPPPPPSLPPSRCPSVPARSRPAPSCRNGARRLGNPPASPLPAAVPQCFAFRPRWSSLIGGAEGAGLFPQASGAEGELAGLRPRSGHAAGKPRPSSPLLPEGAGSTLAPLPERAVPALGTPGSQGPTPRLRSGPARSRRARLPPQRAAVPSPLNQACCARSRRLLGRRLMNMQTKAAGRLIAGGQENEYSRRGARMAAAPMPGRAERRFTRPPRANGACVPRSHVGGLAVQMPADSARFSWMAVRTAADGAAGALETFVYLSCFLLPVFKLAASDYGMKLPILRSNAEDQILYQTERYNEETFGYEVPIKEEGDYVLVLKFAEVYFAQSQQKVFDVRLNGHVVVKDLDIFDRVGHSTAHDEIIPMSIKKGKLSVQGEVSTFTGKLHIEFVKGYYDNPKICALYILQGTVEDVPKLQPHPGLEKKEEDDDEDEYDDGSSVKKQANKNRVQSGPRTPNPYASDNSSLMFPILVAFGVFIPTLFCLCRL